MIKKYLRNKILQIKGEDFQKEYSEISGINSDKQLAIFQKENLEKLILYAYKNVPYYTNIFKDIDLVHNEKVDLSKFCSIPLLTKQMLREHYQELISKDCVQKKSYCNSSGGSTGEPTKFLQDRVYRKWSNAASQYYYQNILKIDDRDVRNIVLWGSTRDLFENKASLTQKISDCLNNRIMLNSFKMTEENMSSYINIINSYKPTIIRGYAGSLYGLCKYAERNILKIYTPKLIISAAETLRDDMREKIEQIFQTKLYDFYGSRETSSLAGECKFGFKHMLSFNQYIEVVNDVNCSVKVGQEGKVVVTTLHNYSMPLIRYEIGDTAILGPEKCQCGNILPTFAKITGRITDHFILQNGTIIPAEYFIHLIGVICNKGFIKQFQVIQENYQKLRILVILQRAMDVIEKLDIENKIKLVMGQDCQIIWEIVQEIPKTSQGKYVYTKSLIH